MKHFKSLALGAAVMAGALVPLANANAWVAAAGGWRGGAVAVGGYHPYYRPSGCYGCGAAVGAVAGMAVGAAIADASRPATVVVQQPAVIVQPPPAYVVQGSMPIGTQIAALPGGARSMVVNGVNYYQAGPTWYKPYFGSSGVYYEVVPAP
ncbi:hypothetical protein QTH87_04355 [Variovorax sp. J22P168]|uniref:hypothetical protein n=1 Tax=Variovorax jilinensis TaxID=3053513 RepID=UPI002574D119|nr:hypothetical protein [Variovorax sp. J22P168]MDM0011667.1 hypothetical protein [Variovorax sp. J22P168]